MAHQLPCHDLLTINMRLRGREEVERQSEARFKQLSEVSRACSPTERLQGRQLASSTPLSSPRSKRQQLFQQLTQSISKLRAQGTKASKIPVSSPFPGRAVRETSLSLSSPSQRYSHLPEPIKKPALNSLKEKPLPSLPAITLLSTPPVQNMSLLDAAEKPLRRATLLGIQHDWPALSPEKATSEHPKPCMDKSEAIHICHDYDGGLEQAVFQNVQNDKSVHVEEFRTEQCNKANPLNYTPRVTKKPQDCDQDVGPDTIDTVFLDPRPAPETPASTKQDRTSSGSSTGRRSSLYEINVLKSRSNSSRRSKPLSQPYKTLIPQPIPGESFYDHKPSRGFSGLQDKTIKSSIPRLRGVSATGSPFMHSARPSTRTVQSKQVLGSISAAKKGNAKNTGAPSSNHGIAGVGADTNHSTASPTDMNENKRQSSLPIATHTPSDGLSAMTIMSTWMKVDACEEQDRELSKASSIATTVKEDVLLSPTSMHSRNSSLKENVSLHSTKADEQLSPVHTFRFPKVPEDEEITDNTSEITRVTSMSSMSKAGTIYGQDENGCFRSKPLSKADPKHGPRVRIENSADCLLLDDEQLAKINAKREAYQQKHLENNSCFSHNNALEVPELPPLCSNIESFQVQVKEDKVVCAPPSEKAISESIGGGTSKEYSPSRTLAPSIPVDIPLITHSPSGWPLTVSKIAPFAEVDHLHTSTIRSKHELFGIGQQSDGPETPSKDPLNPSQHSPPSAYTLRTALHQIPKEQSSPCGKAQPKSSKSLPELATQPLFPTRTSSKLQTSTVSNFTRSRNQDKASEVLRSYVNQRAELKAASRHDNRKTDKASDEYVMPAVTVQKSDIERISPFNQMQSYNTSIRHMNAHEDIGTEMPSSPLPISGSVNTGKPIKMMSRIGGLFHKSSRDGILPESNSNGSLARNGNANSPLSESYNVTPVTARRNNATSPTPANTSIVSPNYVSSPLSSPPLGSDHFTHISAAAVYHNTKDSKTRTSAETNTKRKLPRVGHKHTATQPQVFVKTEEKRDLSPQFMTSALEPNEIRDATTLAFNLLDRARDVQNNESGMEHRQQYIELAKVVVSTVTFARDAEKAKEEAQQAAARAQIECVKARQAVTEVCEGVRKVMPWQSLGTDEV